MPLKDTKSTKPAQDPKGTKADDLSKAVASGEGSTGPADNTTGANIDGTGELTAQAQANVLAGTALDPNSPEAQAVREEQARLDALGEQQLEKERKAEEDKKRQQEEAQAKQQKKEDMARKAKLEDAQSKAEDKAIAKDKLPPAGKYTAAKARLRDPISGLGFLVGQPTKVKKEHLTKWLAAQVAAGLIVEFVEEEDEE